MNLWDSIHRGLDKASQEAARIAKVQRLRAIIDGLTRHINTQHTVLIGKSMELYTSGQLIQSELLPICQALADLQQQMQQAQSELQLLQGSTPTPPPPPQLQSTGTAPQAGTTMLYPAAGETVVADPFAPPPEYQPYASNGPITSPPPVTGGETFGISAMETVIAPPPPPSVPAMQPPSGAGVDAPRYCAVCQAELNPSYAFCHNCGTPVQHGFAQMPTMRANVTATEETQQTNGETSEQKTILASESPAPTVGENEEV